MAHLSVNQLKLSKRGVYAITGEGKLTTFRLIRWEQILKTLKAAENLAKTNAVRSGCRPVP